QRARIAALLAGAYRHRIDARHVEEGLQRCGLVAASGEARIDDRLAQDAPDLVLDAVVEPGRHEEVVAAEPRRALGRLDRIVVHDDERERALGWRARI